MSFHWIRVEDPDGNQFDVAASALDPEIHKKVKSDQWPDLIGETARPRPVLYRTDKAGRPATSKKE